MNESANQKINKSANQQIDKSAITRAMLWSARATSVGAQTQSSANSPQDLRIYTFADLLIRRFVAS
jgi:hypothetical protein